MGSTAQHIDRPVACDAHQPPWNASSFGVVRLTAPPRAQERILQNLPSQLGITDDPERQRVHQPPVTRVHRFEGGFVAALHATDEFGVGRLLATRSRVSAPPEIAHARGLTSYRTPTEVSR